eukprot:CAMPEP_0184706408 /NCGR_PEP_ID=MMETSP0313-20130426/36745_1 /TAXON_ID=2792 /ORGANISM="Porphyridium aerugineum, Strain SAG 1380-2" /LENGTH=902 /DNA_ID=CAMNT_0027167961 /DNA_START=196 /DNA_END=2904 /DNA_ORIENTATION=-
MDNDKDMAEDYNYDQHQQFGSLAEPRTVDYDDEVMKASQPVSGNSKGQQPNSEEISTKTMLKNQNADETEGFTDLQVLEGNGGGDGGGDGDDFSVHDDSDGEDMQKFGEEEAAVSLILTNKNYTKLETISAREVSRLVTIDNIIYLVSILYCISIIIAFNTDAFSVTIEGRGDTTYKLVDPRKNINWQYFEIAVKLASFGWVVFVACIFTFRIMRVPATNRTFEQMWVILLAWAVSIYLMPYDEIITLIQQEQGLQGDEATYRLQQNIIYSIQLIAFTFATVFYVWSSAHSYRLLRGRLSYVFYAPKLVVSIAYVSLQMIALYVLALNVAPLPFVSFFAMVAQLAQYHDGYADYAVIFTMVLTWWETLAFFWVLRDIAVTRRVLKRVNYVRFRTKQIGFRFFLFSTLIFYSIFWLIFLLLSVAVPTGLFAKAFNVYLVSNYRPIYLVSFLSVILVTYVTSEAYVKLPADSYGWKGWFAGQPIPKDRVGDENNPMTYKKRESVSFSGVFEDLAANCFVMQTHVVMFNFSWYVYYHGTKKGENFKLKKDVFDFQIHSMISDKATDSHVLVVDGTDRIVVAFRGTTSAKNLKTDIAIKLVRLDAVLPTAKDEGRIGFAEDYDWVYDDPLYNKARLHQGFSEAYRAIAEPLLATLKKLYTTKRRPIFLTGHSLGGCLATLCSFDLALSFGLGKREMFVSTFGSPRLGNLQWREIYNQLVPIHWRIVLAPDLVTKLPKFTYRHCGKKVLITTGGELFLDPNALELKMWHGETASVLYHRKASYLLAMRGWCELHHGDEYVPEFWPWPVSVDDSKRFDSIAAKSTSSKSSSLSKGSSMQKNQYKLLARDSLMNKLDQHIEASSEDPVAQWARLTRRLLVSIKLEDLPTSPKVGETSTGQNGVGGVPKA